MSPNECERKASYPANIDNICAMYIAILSIDNSYTWVNAYFIHPANETNILVYSYSYVASSIKTFVIAVNIVTYYLC